MVNPGQHGGAVVYTVAARRFGVQIPALAFSSQRHAY